jgi:hypothetical protein
VAGFASGKGDGATAAGAGATMAGGNADTGGAGTGTGIGTGADTAGVVRRTDIGPPVPGRNPGMPNCRDRTSACSSRETSTPIASRRSEASLEMTGRAVVALCMLVVSHQVMNVKCCWIDSTAYTRQ